MTNRLTFAQVQASLNRRFSYRADQGEHWRIMRGTGPVQGDCEDYDLTLIWLAEGKRRLRFWWALMIRRYVLWYVLSPSGAGHVVLWVRGQGWTDNITRHAVPRWSDMARMGYRRRFPYPVFLIAIKFLTRRLTGRRRT